MLIGQTRIAQTLDQPSKAKNKNSERSTSRRLVNMVLKKIRSNTTISKKQPMCNVVVSLRRRSTRLIGWNSEQDHLHRYGEACAAMQCKDNRKADLPPQTKSTFMTAYSPNCELVASCHGDHNVHVTNLQSGKVVKSLIGHERTPWCISFHPTSNDILATGCLRGEVRVWDLRGGGSESWTNNSPEQSTITSISFHPTDHVLLIASGNGIYFWNWKFPDPFAWIKTSSPLEHVRFVRFEAQGSRIMTGIMNSEEEPAHRDGEEEDEAPARMPAPPQLVARNDLWLNSWFQNTHPFFSMTSRSATSRPLTAWYNLRGRHSRAPPPADTTNPPTVSEPAIRPSVGLRQRRSDISHAHTYSRDHRLILHARVSVQAEIQQQYNRLQQLRRERRRLEHHLRQLHSDRNSLRGGDPLATMEDGGRSSEIDALGDEELSTALRHLTDAIFDGARPDSPNDDTVVTSSNSSRSSTSGLSTLIRSRINSLGDSSSLPSNSRGTRPFISPPQGGLDHILPQLPGGLDPHFSLFSPIRPNIPQESGRSSEPGNPHRIRRNAFDRRSFSRRRSYFNHIWPVPENPHAGGDKATYRLQYWDFNKLEMPEISRSDVHVVVRQCKIHNDSSVDVSKDGRKVAALIWSDTSPQVVQVGVFSLLPSSLGSLLYRRGFDPSQYAVCLSLSPLDNYLAVGLKHYTFLSEDILGQRRTVAQVLRLDEADHSAPSLRIHHPGREAGANRYASINTISWLPHAGQGLIYGTNNGQLRFCFTKPNHE